MIFCTLTALCMFDNRHLTPHSLKEILPLITSALKNGKKHIFWTHFLASEDDFSLPTAYLNALTQSECQIRNRIIFWDQNLYKKFIAIDIERSLNSGTLAFQNLYTKSSNYQRLIIIDGIVFFNMWDQFFFTDNPTELNIFLEYFHNLPIFIDN